MCKLRCTSYGSCVLSVRVYCVYKGGRNGPSGVQSGDKLIGAVKLHGVQYQCLLCCEIARGTGDLLTVQ